MKKLFILLSVALCFIGVLRADGDGLAEFMSMPTKSHVMVQLDADASDLEYAIENNELQVVQYNARRNDADVAVPSEIGGLTVTSIGETVFSEQVLLEITLPCACFERDPLIRQPLVSCLQGIHDTGFARDVPRRVDFFRDTSIQEEYALKRIALPDTITSIGAGAFLNCRYLTNITLSASLARIGASAFSGNATLARLELPPHLTTIGHSAFSYCTSLRTVVIPDKVAILPPRTFHGCCSLDSITIGKGVRAIFQGDAINDSPGATKLSQTFWHCCNLTNITVHPANRDYRSVDGVLYSADMRELILCPAGKKDALAIPPGVRKIHRSAFSGSRLQRLIIPDSVMEIGPEAFEYADISEGIHLPANLTVIRQGLFRHAQTDAITIGGKVRRIEDDAFAYCAVLWQVELPESLKSIGDRAFAHCSNLHVMEIPAGVNQVGDNVFYGCTKLRIRRRRLKGETAQAQDCVYAFADGESFLIKQRGWGGDMVLPDRVGGLPLVAIGAKAFAEVEAKVIEESGCQEGCRLDIERAHYPHISAEQDSQLIIAAPAVYFDRYDPYGDRPLKPDFGLRSIVMTDNIKWIGRAGFMNCAFLTNIILSASLTDIGEHAFSGCEKLADIKLPDTLKTIGHSAFSYCTALRQITIPDQVSELLPRTFVSCRNLRSVTLGKGVARIMQGNLMAVEDFEVKMSQTFWHCCNLTNITVDPANPFYRSREGVLYTADMRELVLCPTDKRGMLTIPAGVNKIHNSAFAGSRLSALVIPDSVVEIGVAAFEDATIPQVNLPPQLTLIRQGLFQGAAATKITMGDMVHTIEDQAFAGCDRLDQLTLSRGLTTIGNQAFSHCQLRLLELPAGILKVGHNALEGNDDVEIKRRP